MYIDVDLKRTYRVLPIVYRASLCQTKYVRTVVDFVEWMHIR